METRNPDSSCNPYLAYAALLVAGLDGVRKKIQPAPHINDNIYAFSPKEKQAHGIENLPGDLKDALNAFEADKVLCNAFGPAFVENFLALKRKDVSEFATTVHPWELEKYVNI